MAELRRMLLQNTGPISIRFLDITGNVFHPFFLNVPVVIQIKLFVYNFPSIDRIDICSGPHCNGIRSVPAVLGRVLLGIGLEHFQMLGG